MKVIIYEFRRRARAWMRILSCFLFFIYSSNLIHAQCHPCQSQPWICGIPSNLNVLFCQSDVDALEGTEVIWGGLIIGWPGYITNITNLDALSSLTKINGNSYHQSGLEINSNPLLTNLNGLSSLTEIDNGTVSITDNPLLTNLDGLSSLATVSGGYSFIIRNNPLLTNLDGLSSLTSVDFGILYIEDNAALTNLDGLSSMISVDILALYIENNAALTNLDGLSSLTEVGDFGIIIQNNPLLTNLDGLSKVTVTGVAEPDGINKIQNNVSLSRFCGLYNLMDAGFGQDFIITGNATNPSVSEILSSGPCCPSELTVTQNVASGSTDNQRALVLTASNVIESGATAHYSGGTSITLKQDFHAKNGAIFHAIIEPCVASGLTSARVQAPQIEQKALLAFEKNDALTISLYPNPAQNKFTIDLENLEAGKLEIQIYNVNGVLVRRHIENVGDGAYVKAMNLLNLPSGLYMVKVLNGTTSRTGKILKQ